MNLLSYNDWKNGKRPEDLQIEVKEIHGGLLPINEAKEEDLLRIKGIGPKSLGKILAARPFGTLEDLENSEVPKLAVAALRRHYAG